MTSWLLAACPEGETSHPPASARWSSTRTCEMKSSLFARGVRCSDPFGPLQRALEGGGEAQPAVPAGLPGRTCSTASVCCSLPLGAILLCGGTRWTLGHEEGAPQGWRAGGPRPPLGVSASQLPQVAASRRV